MQQREQYWVLRDLYTFHLSTPELAIIEVESAEHHGPPPHAHSREDESFYVLSGRLQVLKGAEQLEVGEGDFVHFPKGVPHTFRTISPEGSRILVTLSPGSFAELFREIGVRDAQVAQNGDVLNLARTQLIAAAERYGLQVVASPAA